MSVVPEVIAEATGYARSQRRSDGLHILMDVGASTLDLCTFLLRDLEGDDHYQMLTADVQTLGTLSLYRALVEAVSRSDPELATQLWDDLDPLNPFPAGRADVSVTTGPANQEVGRAANAHRSECRKMLGRTVVEPEDKEGSSLSEVEDWHPHLPVRWRQEHAAIRGHLGGVLQGHDAAVPWNGRAHRRVHSRPPSVLSAEIAEQDYHRLAVAWGLSYPDHEIGDIARPDEAEDIVARREVIKKEEPWER